MRTIEIGIDLGTTNSAAAVATKTGVTIVKNNLGDETTPSAVYADKNGTLVVGTKARRKLQEDNLTSSSTPNGRIEVKRLMGTNEKVVFPNLPKQGFLPEELSAEILKSLSSDVSRKFPNVDLSGAVITVPAHFSTVQSEATKRAAAIAGFQQCVLLQEPIAAAIAYGLLNQKNQNWIVYDFGGGTFDVALVALRDGNLTVLAHNGDNFLGGKDLDCALVDKCLSPFLSSKGITLNPKTDPTAYQHLKLLAEQAKIELTTSASAEIEIRTTIAGRSVDECLQISQEDLRGCCEDIFLRTVQLCNETIRESNVAKESISKVVLVGGPTQMPSLRTYLERSLDITVDGSLDPLTVVAQGAAIFACQIPAQKPAATDTTVNDPQHTRCIVTLNYEPTTSSDFQTVTGKVASVGTDTDPIHSICIQTEDGSFSSGDILLKNGKFACQVPTGLNGHNYWIYTKSKLANLIPCDPEAFSISRGLSITGAPIPHSVGVSVISLSAEKGFSSVEESMDFFFKKNSVLPLKSSKRFFTVYDVRTGSEDNALPIRVYEGESTIPDRNTLVCDLAITGKMVPRDLAKGSPVDIAISINTSRELEVSASIPHLDLTLNARATIYEAETDMKSLGENLKQQQDRSKKVSEQVPEEQVALKERIADIEATINRSSAESDQKRKAAKQVRELMVALDNIEAKSKFESNAKKYYEIVQDISAYLSESRPVEKRQEYTATFDLLKRDATDALTAQDPIALQQAMQKLHRFHYHCLFNDPKFLYSLFIDAKENKKDRLSEPAIAQILVQCEKAIEANKVDDLRSSVLALVDALDQSAADSFKHLKAGITR